MNIQSTETEKMVVENSSNCLADRLTPLAHFRILFVAC